MYDTILVPTDGSAAVVEPVERAVDLAESYDATVHALYVVDSSAYGTLDMSTSVVVDSLEEEGETAVGYVADEAEAAGVPVETAVVHGTPHRTIMDYVDEHDVDLVVMGTHGRRGVDRFLLGSVTEKVVRTAPVPVMTVRVPDEEE
jgi:nucleotide-binding universal stress UspA family protein